MEEIKDEVNESTLSEQELKQYFSVVEQFFNYAYHPKNQYIGTYTPYLTNQRLGEIGLNAIKLDKTKLDKALKNPIVSQNLLACYSDYLKLTDSIAKRTINYLGNLPAFDYTIHCTNMSNLEEYNSLEYKQDENIIKDFLSKFNPKREFSAICRRMMTIDTYYSVFRTDGKYNYGFQELPFEYCKITGRNLDWGYQFDFNMQWFFDMGLSIDQYPPIFKEMYDRVIEGSEKEYNPANKLKKRKGTYSLWSQTSSLPSQGNFACFKFDDDITATVPYLTAMFEDTSFKPFIRQLQNNQYIIASQKLLVGLIPYLTNQKSGQVKDSLALSPELLGNFLGLMKKGLSEAIKISGLPFEDVKQIDFTLPEKNMLNESNKIQSRNSGVTNSLVYGSDNPTATEVVISSEIDEIIATKIYPQFERWLSSELNNYTKKYKFSVKFEGTNYRSDKEKRLSSALKLADKGMVMIDKISAALGMNEFEFKDSLAKTKMSDFKDLLFLLPNVNTKDSGEIGRPQNETLSTDISMSQKNIGENV